MKHNRFILALALSLGCLACANSEGTNPKQSDQSISNDQVLSKLDRIEMAFAKGDSKSACALQVQLSKDLLDYDKLSPELLKSVKEFQVKCGSRSFSANF